MRFNSSAFFCLLMLTSVSPYFMSQVMAKPKVSPIPVLVEPCQLADCKKTFKSIKPYLDTGIQTPCTHLQKCIALVMALR